MITVFLTVLHVIVSLILILVILLQAGRGQGLTGPTFGSGNVQSLFGTRAGDFLTKATSVSAILFLLTCIGLNMIEARKSRSLLEGPRSGAPVDIEAIKQALEKAKTTETTEKAKTSLLSEEGKDAVEKAMEAAKATAPEGSQVAVEQTSSGTVVETTSEQPFSAASAPAAPAPAEASQ